MKSIVKLMIMTLLILITMPFAFELHAKADSEMQFEYDTSINDPQKSSTNDYYYTGFDPNADKKQYYYDIVEIFDSPTAKNMTSFVQKVAVLHIAVLSIAFFVFVQGEKPRAMIRRVIIAWIVIFLVFSCRIIIANTLQAMIDLILGQTQPTPSTSTNGQSILNLFRGRTR